MALKQHMLKCIEYTAELSLIGSADYPNVLFRFEGRSSMSEEGLARLNIAICRAMLEQDLGHVDYARHKGRLGIRYTLANGALDAAHIDAFLDHCLRTGRQIEKREY